MSKRLSISLIFLLLLQIACSLTAPCSEQATQFNNEIADVFNRYQIFMMENLSTPLTSVIDSLSNIRREAADIRVPSCVESATVVKEKLLNYMLIQENALIQAVLPLSEEQNRENFQNRQADANDAETLFVEEFNAFQEVVKAFNEVEE